MKYLLARITNNRSLFFKLLVASFLVNILALATPIYVIQVLQRYVAYGVTSTLVTLVLGVTFIAIFEFFFRNGISVLDIFLIPNEIRDTFL